MMPALQEKGGTTEEGDNDGGYKRALILWRRGLDPDRTVESSDPPRYRAPLYPIKLPLYYPELKSLPNPCVATSKMKVRRSLPLFVFKNSCLPLCPSTPSSSPSPLSWPLSSPMVP